MSQLTVAVYEWDSPTGLSMAFTVTGGLVDQQGLTLGVPRVAHVAGGSRVQQLQLSRGMPSEETNELPLPGSLTAGCSCGVIRKFRIFFLL